MYNRKLEELEIQYKFPTLGIAAPLVFQIKTRLNPKGILSGFSLVEELLEEASSFSMQ